MKRRRIVLVLGVMVLPVMLWWLREKGSSIPAPAAPAGMSPPEKATAGPLAGSSEVLLEGYGDPFTPPLEDLRKIHRLTTAYFSVIKDASRAPIGGNEDLAAALQGDNPNRQVFLRAGHAVFTPEGLLQDRWGSPLIVHPEAWRQLELRSAGPDKIPYTADDPVLGPQGLPPGRR